MGPYRTPGVPINPDRRARLQEEYKKLTSDLMHGNFPDKEARVREIIRTLKSLPTEPFIPEPIESEPIRSSPNRSDWFEDLFTPLQRPKK